ncbi:hypothetical protein FGO68_gene17478 [Halteria grandinella]|uniref:Uncharacterized protein n=1 Tax=Halteria grandinella TaxID=5974 RepID=A0A8J8NS51_HALGN|nr:hypothetical protein FGO68_gene17478 [Halteria grandinella]
MTTFYLPFLNWQGSFSHSSIAVSSSTTVFQISFLMLKPSPSFVFTCKDICVFTDCCNRATNLMFTSALRRADAISVRISWMSLSSITFAWFSFLSAEEIFWPSSASTMLTKDQYIIANHLFRL